MSKQSLIIRPATNQDYNDIGELLNNVFKMSISRENREKLWKWRYYDNPARIKSIPQFLIAEKDGKIVGVHGLIPIKVKISDKVFIASCSCDLAIAPSARSVGMVLKLKAMSKDISAVHFSTSANKAANKITLALGGMEMHSGKKKFIKPLIYYKLLEKKVMALLGKPLSGIISGTIGKLLDILSSIKNEFSSYTKIQDGKIEKIVNFDNSFNVLWDRISHNYPNIVIRDSDYLNWRYIKYPFNGIRPFMLKRNDDLLGYAVIHNSFDEGNLPFTAILEIIAQPNEDAEIFEHLLGECLSLAKQNGSHYIQIKITGLKFENILMSKGFKVKVSDISPVTIKNNTELPDEVVSKDENWLITLGDGDICYFMI